MAEPYVHEPTPDERLLKAEALRALERLRRLRDRIEELRSEGQISTSSAAELRDVGEFDRTDQG